MASTPLASFFSWMASNACPRPVRLFLFKNGAVVGMVERLVDFCSYGGSHGGCKKGLFLEGRDEGGITGGRVRGARKHICKNLRNWIG